MLRLEKTSLEEIVIAPRWPYRQVLISEPAYESLLNVQQQLQIYNIQLVLTRGYESQGVLVRWGHKILRMIGACLFGIIYPKRINECSEIFSANGHDVSASCIDLGIRYEKKLLQFLPYGVFTHKDLINRIFEQYKPVVDLVWQSLESQGFRIHKNVTESMQIHCEFSS